MDAVENQARDRGALHKSYTLQSVRKLLIRHGFPCPIPDRRPVERDEEQVTDWGRRLALDA
ncbi:winged helix-turn-helix domain-containing protein [Streptomyces sp. NBC_00986]|uniref:winged helix-turn-helix domain-containing protein n=1 Tax=Streptomyces sp. NBC_00986 TaxID=2903702 RepID=UPI0038674B85|nr:winged helix-turn-helix domain-containing protein [Streptomyces sp. NBC_00986]